MWRLTEPDLRRQSAAVWQNVLRGDMVALSRDGIHQVMLTRMSLMPSDVIDWDDYVRDVADKMGVYARVADRDERIEAVHGSDVIYFVPIRVLAPVGATQAEIERWLDEFADDWIVGPTFVAIANVIPPDPNARPVIELRL